MTVVFLHIDRTGGMAIRDALAGLFPRDAIRAVPHHRKASHQTHAYPVDYNADWSKQNRGFRHGGQGLVMGHWDAGILAKIPGEKRVVTVLREPAARAASLWRYIAAEQAMYGKLSDEARRLGMLAFLEKYRGLWANVQTAQMAGSRWSGGTGGYEQAVANMQGFEVWVTERLAHFRFGGKWLLMPIVNATSTDTVADGVRELVANEAAWDVDLYELAKARCEDEL